MRRLTSRLTEEYKFWIRAVGAAVSGDEISELLRFENEQSAASMRRLHGFMQEPSLSGDEDEVETMTTDEKLANQLEAMLEERREPLRQARSLADGP